MQLQALWQELNLWPCNFGALMYKICTTKPSTIKCACYCLLCSIRAFLWDILFSLSDFLSIKEAVVCNVYNMSGRVVSDIQTRAEGESLYIRYNTDANVVNNLKNDSSYKFIGEVILKINVV